MKQTLCDRCGAVIAEGDEYRLSIVHAKTKNVTDVADLCVICASFAAEIVRKP